MKYAGPGIFAGLILGIGIISNAFSTIQVADAASGPLHFHFTNIPLFGQQVIIKLSRQQSGSTQWRTNFMNLSSPCDIKNPCIQPPVIPVNSTVSTTIKNEFAGDASANQPMSIQTISVNPAGFVADKLDDTALERGVQIKLVSNFTSPVDKAGSLQP